MAQQEESFNVSIAINPGLEPLTFNIIPSKHPVVPKDEELSFKVTRDTETLAVLKHDQDQGWQQLEGKLEQKEIAAIGRAIEAYFAG